MSLSLYARKMLGYHPVTGNDHFLSILPYLIKCNKYLMPLGVTVIRGIFSLIIRKLS
jgi:hypothetical protein